MTVQDLISQLRLDLNDILTIEFSDTELITKINTALNWLALELATLGAPLVLTATTLTVRDGRATLPNDFISETAVISNNQLYISGNATIPDLARRRAYLITGNQLLISLPNDARVTLYYYRFFPPVSSVSDRLPVPAHFIDIIREHVLLTARRRIDLPFPTDLLNDLKLKVRQLAYANTPNTDVRAPFVITGGFTW